MFNLFSRNKKNRQNEPIKPIGIREWEEEFIEEKIEESEEKKALKERRKAKRKKAHKHF